MAKHPPKRRGHKQKARALTSGDRMLAALALFTLARPEWTVEEAAERLGTAHQGRVAQPRVARGLYARTGHHRVGSANPAL
jgi:hypothetical protein